MHDLGRNRRPMDGRRAACLNRSASWARAKAQGASAQGASGADIPADQRQPCGASTSRPIRTRWATLEEAINKVKALPVKPSFMIHTGDITHLSKVLRIR